MYTNHEFFVGSYIRNLLCERLPEIGPFFSKVMNLIYTAVQGRKPYVWLYNYFDLHYKKLYIKSNVTLNKNKYYTLQTKVTVRKLV